MALPKDPVMLLSFVNTQLRDNYSGLKELAAAYDIDTKRRNRFGYECYRTRNRQ